QGSTDNVIQGNYIGVTKDGTAPLQPPVFASTALFISSAAGSNTIAGNVILGTNTGLLLGEGNTGHNIVQGNFIGTNATGTAGLGGGIGLDVQSNSDTISGNVISGGTFGILIDSQGTAGPGPTIQGNKIGIDIT